MAFLDLIENLLIYKTIKIVEIKHWKLGLIHYGIQLLILGYILGWVIIYNKGYQGEGYLVGDANIKVKGNSFFINEANGELMNWDENDAVFPPKEEDTFFITTNFHITYGQSRSVCLAPSEKTKCTNNAACAINHSMGVGITNGTCAPTGYCYLHAWCPPEPEDDTTQILTGIADYTAFVKLSVQFPTFNILRNNVDDNKLEDGYNLFTVDSMLRKAKTTIQEVNNKGAVIIGNIKWNCNFDKPQKECRPTFDFVRIDQSSTLSPGYNFRYTKNYYLPSDQTDGPVPGFKEHRDLYKVCGIRFLFMISGSGRKFDIVPLLVNIGSGLALLGVATVVSDFLALHVLPQRKFYTKVKYEEVEKEINGERKALLE